MTSNHAVQRPVTQGHDSQGRSMRSALLLLAAASLIAGCATPLSPKEDAPFQSYASANDHPAHRPSRSMSSFSNSLACMDEMMREAEVPTTLITSKFIADYTGRVPVAAKEMVITALSQMSRRSNAFRYVDFEVDIARQDTVQNLSTILLNNNQMELQRPALYVSGGVSFVDQNVISTRHGAGISGRAWKLATTAIEARRSSGWKCTWVISVRAPSSPVWIPPTKSSSAALGRGWIWLAASALTACNSTSAAT